MEEEEEEEEGGCVMAPCVDSAAAEVAMTIMRCVRGPILVIVKSRALSFSEFSAQTGVEASHDARRKRRFLPRGLNTDNEERGGKFVLFSYHTFSRKRNCAVAGRFRLAFFARNPALLGAAPIERVGGAIVTDARTS